MHRVHGELKEIVLNMNPVRSHVLAILGPQFKKNIQAGEEVRNVGYMARPKQ